MTHFSHLTDIKIKSLKAQAKPYKVFDGQGLYLEVTPAGGKKWRLRYLFEGKDKRITLGNYPVVGLKEAREKAFEQRKVLDQGKDPLGERQREAQERAQAKTFLEAGSAWEASFLDHLAPNTKKKKKGLLANYVYPLIGKIPLIDLTPFFLLNKVIKPLETEKKLETAHRVKMLCSQIFRFAVANGWAERDITYELRGAIPQPKVQHRATIIDPPKIGHLLVDIYDYHGQTSVAYALRLLPLLFVRPGELRHAEWTEINFEEAIWRIPGEKMKMGTPHIVPLARQALEIIRELKEVNEESRYLFPGQRSNQRPISDVAMIAALRYLGYTKEQISPHGFRAMASTLLNEQGYNRDWIERQLAHSERDGVRAAYNYAEYLPERRKMMQDWADYLEGLRADGLARELRCLKFNINRSILIDYYVH